MAIEKKDVCVQITAVGGSIFFRIPDSIRDTYSLKREDDQEWVITVDEKLSTVCFRKRKKRQEDGDKKSD